MDLTACQPIWVMLCQEFSFEYIHFVAELGDFDHKRHTYGYVSEFRFGPHQTEELEDTAADLHRTLM